MDNGFSVGNKVQVRSDWCGVIKSIIRTQDGYPIGYFVEPINGFEDDGMWIDYDEVALYNN